ncbi:MAG: glycerol-3-phosphate acyltransferase [Ignavibacteria bacterium]|nr:glycerol-3-phosphate acyltransferase [Ignavibacteria bacterium]
MSLIYVCAAFYLIGSVPTAYLLVKYRYGKNLLNEGTGNIGAMNTYDVTHSRTDGIIVLTIDLLKGLIPVLWFLYISGYPPESVLIPSVFLLAGHNFSVWLKFKGGRGLATGAGMMLAVNFSVVVFWLIFYGILKKTVNNVHIASVIALIMLPLSVLLLQQFVLKFSNPVLPDNDDQLRFLFTYCSSICILILIRHIDPITDFIKNRNLTNKT